MSRAVTALRDREKWSQTDLATVINRAHRRTEANDVSRWERDLRFPSAPNRLLMAKVAAKLGYHDLARIFRTRNSHIKETDS